MNSDGRNAPSPMTPAAADLQDFAFMPLHVARLRDSDLAGEGDPAGCWYAVLLWCAAWHQLPAGSLPDNDAVLARLCGLGRDLRSFRKHRSDALRGFVRCSDGRLYHPVVAEQVIAAWQKKLEQRWRSECARIKKANQRHDTDHPLPSFDAWLAGGTGNAPAASVPGDMTNPVPGDTSGTAQNVPGENHSKRQGEGEGQGDYISEAEASGGAAPPDADLIDPEKLVFDQGIRLLAAAGIDEAKARRVLGKWKRDHGPPAVIAALGSAQRAGAIDPVSFIEGIFNHGNRLGRHHDRPSGAIESRRRFREQHDVEDRPSDAVG